MAYELVQAMLEAEYRANDPQQVERYRIGMRHAAMRTPDERRAMMGLYCEYSVYLVDATAFIRGYIAMAYAITEQERKQPHGLHPS